MERLIDANKYCDFLNRYPLEKAQSNFMTFYRDVLRYTFECEVEAEPVKHGHWIKKGKLFPELDNDSTYEYECSECRSGETHNENVKVPYCWHCGAKMDEVEDDD